MRKKKIFAKKSRRRLKISNISKIWIKTKKYEQSHQFLPVDKQNYGERSYSENEKKKIFSQIFENFRR